MFGGYAQYVARPENYWLKASPSLDVDRAAASMWACATAHHVVAARLNAPKGDTVLITGAAGGMGTATLLLAKLAGCRVIATSRFPGKTDALKKLGADLVVDTNSADVARQIRAFTGGEGVDGAVEYTGATELMRLCIDAMRLGGTFCPVGRNERGAAARRRCGRQGTQRARRARRDTRRSAHRRRTAGERPARHADAVLPLSKIGEAHRFLESAPDLVGRIVLHPWDD
jgi:NADPH:quinone reductase-like Zn-dependent oxidoreductase